MESGDSAAPHLFSRFTFAGLQLKNRTVRSATADAQVYNSNRVEQVTIDRYTRLANSDIGMIITGDFVVSDTELIAQSAADHEVVEPERVDDEHLRDR